MYNTNPNDNYNTNNYTSAPGSYGQVPPASYTQTPAAPKSNNKKLVIGIIAGFALLCTAAGSMKGQNNAGGFGQPGQFTPTQNAMYNTPQNGYNGQPSQYNTPQNNEYNGDNKSDNGSVPSNGGGFVPQSGEYAYNTPAAAPASSDNGSDAIVNGYWGREREKEQGYIAFDQTVRDTNTVQDQNGTIYTDVDNSVANPAIDAGTVTEVPTSELPTSYDTPAPAAEAPTAEAPAADTSSSSE